jgi:hypothetical protein
MSNNTGFQVELAQDGSGRVRTPHTPSEEEFQSDLAKAMLKRTDKLGKVEVELALQVKQAREFLEWSSHHIRDAWMEWMHEADKALTDIRQLRVAMTMESKTAIGLAKDVTDQFNSPEMVSALARFKDVADLLSKVRILKDDGTLDAFADFILKIKCTS